MKKNKRIKTCKYSLSKQHDDMLSFINPGLTLNTMVGLFNRNLSERTFFQSHKNEFSFFDLLDRTLPMEQFELYKCSLGKFRVQKIMCDKKALK